MRFAHRLHTWLHAARVGAAAVFCCAAASGQSPGDWREHRQEVAQPYAVGDVPMKFFDRPPNVSLPPEQVAGPPGSLVSHEALVPRAETARVSYHEQASGACEVHCDGHCESGCCACEQWYVSLASQWQKRWRTEEIGDPDEFLVYHDGLALDVALGYRCQNWRFEVEYSHFYNEIDRAANAGGGTPSVGSANLQVLMFNFYRDFCIPGTCLRPYIGAGAGGYRSELCGVQPNYFQQIAGPFFDTPFSGTSDIAFAWQVRYGASFVLSQRTELFCGYRYFWGDEVSFAREPFSLYPLALNHDATQNHGVELGLRVSF